MRIVLIPAYEPDERLINLVADMVCEGFNAVVVNDGSKRDHDHIFKTIAPYAKVICHEKNMGKGAALKTGLKYILKNFRYDDVVVTMDADGQHLKKDAILVCDNVEKDRDALVLGCRGFDGDNVPKRSRIGNSLTAFVYKMICGEDIKDTQTGLRGFCVKSIPKLLAVGGERYEYEMKMLMQWSKEKGSIIQVPVETVYIGENETSHYSTVKDSLRILKEIISFGGASALSFVLDFLIYTLALFVTGTKLGLINSVVISNVFARVISGAFNFTLNRRFVFGQGKGKPLLKYTGVAVLILMANTFLLNILCGIGIETHAAKLMTEMSMWGISYLLQKTFVFGKGKEKDHEKTDKKGRKNIYALGSHNGSLFGNI